VEVKQESKAELNPRGEKAELDLQLSVMTSLCAMSSVSVLMDF
jgi:hypothetical protein